MRVGRRRERGLALGDARPTRMLLSVAGDWPVAGAFQPGAAQGRSWPRAPRTPGEGPQPHFPPRGSHLQPTTAGRRGTVNADNFSQTRTNTSRNGYASDNDTTTRRTLTRITAPIFNSLTPMVSHCACANSCPCQAVLPQCPQQDVSHRRQAQRTWLARIVRQLTRLANSINCCSLIRFSISPRPQYSCSYNAWPAKAAVVNDETTKRGLGPLARCSALPTTRRCRLQLSCVR